MDQPTQPGSRDPGGLVEVASFFYRHEAELARSVLSANGIEAIVTSDDTGGQGPGLQYVLGAHLLVHPGDAALARQILVSGEEGPEGGEAPETEEDAGEEDGEEDGDEASEEDGNSR